ncbi:MAG: helix-turn-helix transcriptional regulator [Alphaproteobacteria bacterium]|nr:helix-turn-helix transcriptional regulator [Alphaproteobacteria bacterium]
MHNRLKLLRKKIGVKQWEFAEKLGLSPTYYSEVEKGKKSFSATVLLSLYKLNVNLDWLIGGEGEMFRTSGSVPSDPLLSDLVFVFNQLSENSKKLVLNYAHDQKDLQEYRKIAQKVPLDC